MNDLHNENQKTPSQNLQVWYCEHCRNVHFRTQNVMLDFSKKEFVELTNTILDIFQNHLEPLEIDRIAEMISPPDDVLMSETIS